jgi:hypothetical protein
MAPRDLDLDSLSALTASSDAVLRIAADIDSVYRQLNRSFDTTALALASDRITSTIVETGTVFQQLNRHFAAATLAFEDVVQPFQTIVRDIEQASVASGRIFTEITRSLSAVTAGTDALRADLDRFAEGISRLIGAFDDASLANFANQAQAAYTALTRSTVLAQIEPVAWSDLLEGRLASDAPNVGDRSAESQRLTASTAVAAVFEGSTGLDFDWLNTPAKRVRFVVVTLWLLFNLWSFFTTQRRLAVEGREAVERRRLEREHAEAIARLTDIVRELQRDQKSTTAQLAAEKTRHVRRTSVLRDGPSSATRRVLVLTAGRRVMILSAYGRWRCVELLTADGRPTGIVGWLYQRNVQADGTSRTDKRR